MLNAKTPLQIIFTTICLLSFSCSKNEDPDIIIPLEERFWFDHVEEKFDKDGNVYIKAKVYTSKPDTIISFGFIYTDARLDPAPYTPSMEKDHVIALDKLILDEESFQSYYFEALINPVRSGSSNGPGDVLMMAYLTGISGNTYFTLLEGLYSDKARILDLYPLYAAPGTVVTGVLNKPFDMIYSYDEHVNKIVPPITISIQGKELPITVSPSFQGSRETFSFIMPSNLNSETSVAIKVGEYEAVYKNRIKNSSIGFKYIADLNRVGYLPFVFATSDNVYIAGGAKADINTMSPESWKYTLTTNSWARISDYPLDGYTSGMAFSVNDQGYTGTPQLMYRYDAPTNTWKSVKKPTGSLGYNYTYRTGAATVYNGKVYITNYDTEAFVGVQYYNFYEFDPITETFTQLPGYPGDLLYTGVSSNGIAFNNLLHFFPANQHWSYNVLTKTWQRLTDIVSERNSIEYLKPFTLKDKLYLIKLFRIYDDKGYSNGFNAQILKYNADTDTWERDSDVAVPAVHEIYPIVVAPDKVFLVSPKKEIAGSIIHQLVL